MGIKRVLLVFLAALFLLILLFLVNSNFDTFKDPADYNEYRDE